MAVGARGGPERALEGAAEGELGFVTGESGDLGESGALQGQNPCKTRRPGDEVGCERAATLRKTHCGGCGRRRSSCYLCPFLVDG